MTNPSQTLIIIRGLPGSGKSTLAKRIACGAAGDVHVEADMFPKYWETGSYVFNPAYIREAHHWCMDIAEQGLKDGHTVIVSNTFTEAWEYATYLHMAKVYEVPAQVIEVHGPWTSIHGVPESTMEKMRDRWQPTTVSDLL
jgi:predicted kinase